MPVGCYLPGGIDSCSILGLDAACRQDPVKAFTIGFDDAGYDGSLIAKRMAASTGADQDVMMLRGEDLYTSFADTHWHTQRTIYNTPNVAKFLMIRHVRDAGYRVVLTGEGSFELFHSMEAQPAFLDHNLAAVAFQIAPDLRIREGRKKHVLREAMKGLLPEELYNRKKFAFMA